MQMIKHVQFTKLIKAGGRLREFNFRRSMGLEGPLFTIDVADQRGDRHYALYCLQDGEWKLKTKNIPDWIGDVIPQIQQAIDGLV